ncbi:transcriptional regulator [Nocardiopsis sp. CNT-189]|uniref:helix-turn-helix domain-containing protein n=1 Tax=Nocardiopsis oceanisediminis TaxID=2816862 RepID=UPI003B2C69D5
MYPRETVNEALLLHTLGWTDREVATALDVSIQSVRHWRTGRRRAPGTELRRAERTAYCPICSKAALDRSAYSYLLGLYLGDGHITRHRRGVHYLSVFCTDSYPSLIRQCEESMGKVFPCTPFRVRRVGCTEVKAASKHWPCVFPQHGPGKKHSRRILLAGWQEEIVGECPQELARGLFHSDGCRINNRVRRKVRGEWKYYDYPRYFFSNTSPDIHAILTRSLDLIGVEWTLRWQKLKNEKHRDAGILSVAKRDSVALLDTFIGPKS